MAWVGFDDLSQLTGGGQFEATAAGSAEDFADEFAAAGVDEQLSQSDVLGRIEAVVAQLVS